MKTTWTIFKEHQKRGDCHCYHCEKVISALNRARDKVLASGGALGSFEEGDALVEVIRELNRGRISERDRAWAYSSWL